VRTYCLLQVLHLCQQVLSLPGQVLVTHLRLMQAEGVGDKGRLTQSRDLVLQTAVRRPQLAHLILQGLHAHSLGVRDGLFVLQLLQRAAQFAHLGLVLVHLDVAVLVRFQLRGGLGG